MTAISTKRCEPRKITAAPMTMDGVQAERTISVVQRIAPGLESQWRDLYDWPPGTKQSYSPKRAYSARLGLRVRELCTKHGLLDRMPRYIAPGPLAINKRIAERLFLKTYDLELEGANDYRIWAYRKAAWAVDESLQNLSDLYREQGKIGLIQLPGIGQSIASEVSRWLQELEGEDRKS